MSIRELPEIITCSYCKSGEYTVDEGRNQDEELHICKCTAVTDFKLRKIEDEKHRTFHETGKEPDDKQNIAPEDKPKDDPPPIERKVNIIPKKEKKDVPEIYS